MSRCICSHIRALHNDGVCRAVVNPCGCHHYQADDGTEPMPGTPVKDDYHGFYFGKKWSA